MEHGFGLTPSLQRYLAVILTLENEHGSARQSDIATRIGVNRSSVTAALRTLAERSLVRYEPYEAVTLTPSGGHIAETISTRREIIREYLVKILEIRECEADDAACNMQHAVPDVVMNRLSELLGTEDKGPCHAKPGGAAQSALERKAMDPYRCVEEDR